MKEKGGSVCEYMCTCVRANLQPQKLLLGHAGYPANPIVRKNASNKLLIIYPKTRFVPKTWFSLSCSN